MPKQADPPDPPEQIPYYVADILRDHANDPDVLAAIHDYIDDLNDYDPPTDPNDVDLTNIGPEGQVVDTRTKDGWTDVVKRVKCGKSACQCTDGTNLHGPYHYRVRRDGDDVEWEYVKKTESSLVG